MVESCLFIYFSWLILMIFLVGVFYYLSLVIPVITSSDTFRILLRAVIDSSISCYSESFSSVLIFVNLFSSFLIYWRKILSLKRVTRSSFLISFAFLRQSTVCFDSAQLMFRRGVTMVLEITTVSSLMLLYSLTSEEIWEEETYSFFPLIFFSPGLNRLCRL